MSNKIRIGDVIDQMVDIRSERQALAKEDAELKSQFDELSEELISLLHASGTDQARSDTATASLSTTLVASVEDPAKLARWIFRNKRLDILQLRVSNPVYRELMENRRQEIPGLSGYKKQTINLRSRK